MKVVLAGGSGHLGKLLTQAFLADGHEAIVLSRRAGSMSRGAVRWDGETLGAWIAELDGADVVVNLAGRSVDCRYSASNRRAILESRIRSTQAIGRAIAAAARPPQVWLQASTATIYAHRYDIANDEANGLIGGDEPHAPDDWRFSVQVARAWEQAANDASTPSTRKTLLRTAIVMAPDRGGAFDVLSRLTRAGLGGAQGDGRQYVSWIHEQDFLRAIYWLIDHDLSGPVNLAAPNPATNAEFMRTLRQAWGVRYGLPVARWMLELGAFVLRTESELVLKSRRVVPARLVASGMKFDFPDWSQAAQDLCARSRKKKPPASTLETRARPPINPRPASDPQSTSDHCPEASRLR